MDAEFSERRDGFMPLLRLACLPMQRVMDDYVAD